MNSILVENESEVIITADEIKSILEHYRIGKKPLAKLLGWGETTIIRYLEGDIPTNEYSNKLKMIINDPEYYYDILVKRKDVLTGVAFKKSKKAVLSKIMSSKIYAVAYYIVNKTDAEICASYIQYLLYYIQAFSFALIDKEMFQEECLINNDNIPFIKLYDAMKRCGIRTLEEMNEEFLSDEDIELIDAVYDSLTWYGPKAISALMNYEKSIMKVSRDKYSNKIIAKESIKSYFKEVLSTYRITNVSEIDNYFINRLPEIREIYQ